MFTSLEAAPTGTRVDTAAILAAARFNADGLLPAIAQDHASGTVLMLAWMNRAALEETLATGHACYWSRSRARLWRKGEESGNVQQVVAVHLDCDGDTVLLQVHQHGPACHTGRRCCFYLAIDANETTVDRDVEVDPDTLYHR